LIESIFIVLLEVGGLAGMDGRLDPMHRWLAIAGYLYRPVRASGSRSSAWGHGKARIAKIARIDCWAGIVKNHLRLGVGSLELLGLMIL